MAYKVVISDYMFDDPEREKAVLEPIGARVFVYDDKSDEERIAHCHDADAILCEIGPFYRPVIEELQRCKAIVAYGAGFDHFDVEAATQHGIYVTNTPGILTDTTADFAFALILALARRIPEADRHIRAGKWIHAWGPRMFIGSDVHGKTLGIVGLGRIGSAVARRARGFDMNLIYFDTLRREDLEEELGVIYRSFEEVLAEADYLTIHVPLTEQTHHLIGDEELSMMKKTAYLINTSRGPVIDEEALYRSLKEGVIAGAALDVFEDEPIDPESPLLGMENVVLTPHIASASRETRTRMAVVAATNLVSVLLGEEPPNLVNPEVRAVRPLKPSK
ncbi:MAG: 2-hydroxyacid dehydrogenase [Candidatus Bathyarchaeia archaeon]